ncbi:mitochondrial ATP synthase g subunit-domain-containing protein, partial [Pholiota molesta]
AYKQPLLYNLAVGKELVKQVYVKEGLHPPSFATVREVYADLAHQLRSPGYISGLLRSGEVGRIGVYGLQAYGLFKIGEMVGRRSIVGYKL